ncbi:hypothetical protein [Calothrix rhizosoleniae]|uniref:hypothetical protein n=1 Tax=Calothrix rhizosoleniae TaxID=888997 RepID=UPI000B4A1D8D|nr:hypothetical protein [Calothrix rhizosoleniae]
MPLLFLLPLFTALISGYICKRSTDEIGQLAGVLAALSLVVSLVSAPWEIQLLLLIAVLVITPKLLWKNTYNIEPKQK